MIAFLRGKIIEINTKDIVLYTNGVGYKIHITPSTIHDFKKDSDISLWIHFAVREDAQDLYGFMTKKDRDFFELLLTVSSIGPKSALNILSLVSSDTLTNAIRTGSINHLVKVSGIGKKTAEKILLELKDKLGSFDGSEEISEEMSSNADVLDALKSLGYDIDQAREALKKVDIASTDDTGAKLKAALKILGQSSSKT